MHWRKTPLNYSSTNGPITFSSSGRRLASVDGKGIDIFDVRANRLKVTLKHSHAPANAIAFNPANSSQLASSHDRHGISLWNVKTAKEVAVIKSISGLAETNSSIAFSKDGRWFASGIDAGFGTHDGIVKIWQVSTRKLVHSVGSGQIAAVAFSPDAKLLACGTGGSDPYHTSIYDRASEKRLFLESGPGVIEALAFSPDGRVLAVGTGRDIQLWDIRRQELVRTIIAHPYPMYQVLHFTSVYSLSFSHNGKWLASIGSDNLARVWEVKSGQCEATFGEHRVITAFTTVRGAYSVAFSPAETLLAVAHDEINLYRGSAR